MECISFDNRKTSVRSIAVESSFWSVIMIIVITELFRGILYIGLYLLLLLLVIRIVCVIASYEYMEISIMRNSLAIIKGKERLSYSYCDFVDCEVSHNGFRVMKTLVFRCNNEHQVIDLKGFSFNQYLQISDLVRKNSYCSGDSTVEYLDNGLFKQEAEKFDIAYYIKMCLGLLLSFWVIASFAVICACYYDVMHLIWIIAIIGSVISLSIVIIILYVYCKANTYKDHIVKEILIGSNGLIINDHELKYDNISQISITPPFLKKIRHVGDNKGLSDYSINRRISLPYFKMEDRILIVKTKESIESMSFILGSRPLCYDDDILYFRLYNSLKEMSLVHGIIFDEYECLLC